MGPEFPEQNKERSVQNKIETVLNSEENFVRLEKWLQDFIGQEEAEQCVFVLRSMSDTNFLNQCQAATQEFGRELNAQFGGEESFFDLASDASYSEVRNYSTMEKINRNDFVHHSVGLLEFKPKDRQSFALIFDLTYGSVSGTGNRKAILAMHSPGDRKQSLDTLKNNYGGKWEVEYEFDKKTGNFVFCDKD